jgi:hypothetical protein
MNVLLRRHSSFAVALYRGVVALLAAATRAQAGDTCRHIPQGYFTLTQWNDPEVWDCDHVPGAGDAVVLEIVGSDWSAQTPYVRIAGAVTIKSLVVRGGRINGDFTLTVTDSFFWSKGDLTYANSLLTPNNSRLILGPAAQGTIQIQKQGFPTLYGILENHGTLQFIPGEEVKNPGFAYCSRFINYGTLTIVAPRASFPCVITNYGTVAVNLPGASAALGNVTNHGTLALAGDRLRIGSILAQGSTLTQLAGTTSLAVTSLQGGIDLRGGVLRGSGVISANKLSNAGMIDPDGILTVAAVKASYVQSPTGVLHIDVWGAQPGSGFDQLNLQSTYGGVAALNGTLEIAIAAGYTPPPELEYNIANFLARSGEFAQVIGTLPVHYFKMKITAGAELPEPTVFFPIARRKR